MSPLSASSLHSGDYVLCFPFVAEYNMFVVFSANYKIYSHPTFLYRYFIGVDNATNARSRSLAPVKDIVVSSILLGIGRWRGVINLKSDAFE